MFKISPVFPTLTVSKLLVTEGTNGSQKIWILSFHWYHIMVCCRLSDLATTAYQSQAIFQNVPKCWKWAYLASGEIPIFGHYFQMATILRPMEIIPWNQLPVTIYLLNFYLVVSAFCYLNPFKNNSILKTGLILNIFFGTSEEMTLQYISYSTYKRWG